jgi:5-hydroxyisourate hydrolase
MNRISTHILDTSRGRPASGVPVRLYQANREISSQVTDADGRCQNLLPDGQLLTPGGYCLVFDTGAYFPEGLYPEVSISFKVAVGAVHYHLPLLLNPFGYTTYRGS